MFDVTGKLRKMKKQPSLPLATLNEAIRVLKRNVNLITSTSYLDVLVVATVRVDSPIIFQLSRFLGSDDWVDHIVGVN